jgi:phosphotriesterase-related protein
MTAKELAREWTREFNKGIGGTIVKPGFIKIGIDSADPLNEMHQKLVRAAALTHLETGLTIASHTGNATGLWPQLKILEEMGVSPKAFIWVHAQNEDDPNQYLHAAQAGCWISLDGLGWELENHIEKIDFAKENGILDRILISHDAGWYDPQKNKQEIKPYNKIMNVLIPTLKTKGFTQADLDLLMSINPARAFSIQVKKEETS